MTCKFTPEHEWIVVNEQEAQQEAIVGITEHAQDALGELVYVDLPEVGRHYDINEVAGTVESVKAASDVYMPVSGTVTAVNEKLRGDPAIANSDPMTKGWFFKIQLSDRSQLDQLLDKDAYDALIGK